VGVGGYRLGHRVVMYIAPGLEPKEGEKSSRVKQRAWIIWINGCRALAAQCFERKSKKEINKMTNSKKPPSHTCE
jgi:hypothetical protein